MFYLLESSFFSSSLDLDALALELDKRVNTERVILNFDPFAVDTFKKKINNKKTQDEILNLALEYYSDLENYDKYSLNWYELNQYCTNYINILGELMLSFNFNDYHISACGVLPILHNSIECCVYYHISPYEDLKDRFHVISFREYRKILNKHKIGEKK